MGNRLIFPANSSTYQAEDIEGLFWIPVVLGQIGLKAPPLDRVKSYYSNDISLRCGPSEWIPCQYLPSTTILGEKYVVIYFHGNSCDLGDMVDEMKAIQENTGFHVVHFEYPGYGICGLQGQKPNPEVIDTWGRAVATFIISCGMPPECIVPMGRSIGTGPAVRLAAYLNDLYGGVGGIVLHSPYISIHAIVEDYAWKIATYLVPNFWNTEQELKKMAPFNIPLLVIHGKADRVIPIRHGRRLYEGYRASEKVKLGWFPEHSEHNCYDVHEDVITPLRIFLTRVGNYRKDTPRRIVPAWGYKKPRQARPVKRTASLVDRATTASLPHVEDTRGGTREDHHGSRSSLFVISPSPPLPTARDASPCAAAAAGKSMAVSERPGGLVGLFCVGTPPPSAASSTTTTAAGAHTMNSASAAAVGGGASVNSFWSRVLFCDCSSQTLLQTGSPDSSGLLAIDEGFMVSDDEIFRHPSRSQAKFERT